MNDRKQETSPDDPILRLVVSAIKWVWIAGIAAAVASLAFYVAACIVGIHLMFKAW